MGDYTYYSLIVADAGRHDAQLLARVVAAFMDDEVGFAVCEEPKREWLGTLCRYLPGTGMHEVDCGPGVNPLIELTTLRALAARHRQPEELLEAITTHLGADLPLLIH